MDIDAIGRVTLNMPVVPEPTFRNEEERQMVGAVRALNKVEYFGSDSELRFSRDPETQRPVIRVVDRQTGEKIDQIPAEQLLHIMASIGQDLRGETKS